VYRLDHDLLIAQVQLDLLDLRPMAGGFPQGLGQSKVDPIVKTIFRSQ
jgi:hypothetical protein